jgi:MtaA/CmuA family methyltransferase
MNSLQRMRAALSGGPADRVCNFNIMMQFASHFIGEPLSGYYQDYTVLCEANIAVLEEFELDIVQAISDPYREAYDFGAEITFPEDGLPVCKRPLISEPSDLNRLRRTSPETGKRMSDRLEAVRFLREAVGDDVPVMGWVEGAVSEAATLRGVNALLTDLVERPEWVKELLSFVADNQVAFARAQAEAGAHIIGLGDSIASQISAALYREFALPHERRIFDAVHDAGALGRLHICGNTTHLLNDMPKTMADIIDLDWMVGLAEARKTCGAQQALCGNFDPVSVMLQGTPAQVRQSVLRNLADGGARFFSAAGCEIPDQTPHPNLRAQAEALAGA